MVETAIKMYRVTCRDDDGEIRLRIRAKDQYEAFEQMVMFLREKEFDYQVVLAEFYGSTLPSATVRHVSAWRRRKPQPLACHI